MEPDNPATGATYAVAYQGIVELLNAMWSLDSGRTVELRITGDAFDRVHPFKRFQKKRNGRVGTRFSAVFSRVEDGANLLTMEVMLAAWKDSSSVGQSITLWLDDEVEMHPFCGCTRRKANNPGDVFALVLVELNDDESTNDQKEPDGRGNPQVEDRGPGAPRDPPKDAPAGSAGTRGTPGDGSRGGRAARSSSRPRRFSASVHLFVTSARYVQWLQETKGTLVKQWTPELARQYTKKVIGIESLSDLDRDQTAVQRFNQEIRRPYDRWAHQDP